MFNYHQSQAKGKSYIFIPFARHFETKELTSRGESPYSANSGTRIANIEAVISFAGDFCSTLRKYSPSIFASVDLQLTFEVSSSLRAGRSARSKTNELALWQSVDQKTTSQRKFLRSQMGPRLKMTQNPARYINLFLFYFIFLLYLTRNEIFLFLIRWLMKSFQKIMSFRHYWIAETVPLGSDVCGTGISRALLTWLQLTMTERKNNIFFDFNKAIIFSVQVMFVFRSQGIDILQMRGIQVISLLLLIVAICCQNAPYNKVVHGTDPEARCLDGSPGALYLSEGDPSRILMYFVGGAACGAPDVGQTLQSCYQRSKIHLGSSIYWPKTNLFGGILSNDPNKNIFANWTKAVFLYCDGAFHQGYAKSPIKYKDTSLYFRGAAITRSHFKYMDSYFSFKAADKVVLTGSSAGGMATFVWADYLKGMLGAQTQFYSVPDSGIFLNPADPMVEHRNLVSLNSPGNDPTQVLLSLSNIDESVPNTKCATALGKQNQYRCLSIHEASLHLQTESLFLESSYDQYIIRYSAGYTCIKEGQSGFTLKDCDADTMKVIEGYRAYYLAFLQKLLQKGHNIWTISCSWHATAILDQFYESPLQKVPHTTGRTMQEAVFDFVFKNSKVIDIDIDPWPQNEACAY